MPKLPVRPDQLKALLAAAATVVGPQVVEMLKDPERAEQLKKLVADFKPVGLVKTPEAKVRAKITALRARVEQGRPGDAAYARKESWEPRLRALDDKVALVSSALTGRERARQLKKVSAQVDELVVEFLGLSDDVIGGR